jgi:L-aspartate oxidase
MGILAAESVPDSLSAPPANKVMDWSYGRAKPISENVLVDHAWASLRSVMWDYVGIVRTDKRLKRSLRFIEVISEEVEEDYWTLLPCIELLELRNICTIGKSIVRSALKRRESRGLHYNLDCPEESPQALNTLIRQDAPA